MTMGDISLQPLEQADSPQELDEEVGNFPEWNPLDPLPDYARAWGRGIRRPTELPVDYDERIDPAHIFVFPKHPVTRIDKPYYVTSRPCTYCTKIRQVCSRSRPLCQRCAVSGDPLRVCEYLEGYVKLPGPRLPKPRAKAAGDVDKDGNDIAEKDHALAPTVLENNGFSQNTYRMLPSAHESSTPEPPLKRRRTSSSREVSDSANISADAAPRGKGQAKGAGQLNDSRGMNPSKTRRVSRKITAARNNLGPGSWEAADGTIWRSLRPNKPSTAQSIPGIPVGQSALQAQRQKPPEAPRIWAASKAEFLAILPELSKALDANGSGIFKEEMALEPPLIFLEGNSWKDDHWGPEGVLELSIVREFTIPRGRGQNIGGFSVDFDDTSDTDQDMVLYDESVDIPGSGHQGSANRSEHLVCHPTTLLKNRATQSTPPFNASPPSSLHNGTSQSALQPYMAQRVAYFAATSQPPPRLTGAFAKSTTNDKTLPPVPRTAAPRPTVVNVLPHMHLPFQSNGAYGHVQHVLHYPLTHPPPPPPPQTLIPWPGPPNAPVKPHTPPHPAVDQNRPYSPRQLSKTEPTQPPLNDGIEPRLRPATFDDRPINRRIPDSVSDDDADEPGPSLRDVFHAQMTSHEPSRSFTDTPPPGIMLVNRPVTIRPPSLVSSASPVGSSHPRTHPGTGWNREVVIPTDLPPELQHMQECKTYGIPVSIVMAKDSVLLPFALGENIGVVYLGFFKIQEISHTIVSSILSPVDGSLTARIRWRYKFKWIPGGDPVEADKPQPNHPWWANIPSDDSHADREPTPYSLLPLHLSSEFTKYGGHYGGGWSDVNPRLGWHCMGCGRLNVQRQLCFQRCSTCGAGNGMVATGAMYVRDPHRMAPDSRPVDTYPEGVLCDIPDVEEDAMRTFVYTLREGVIITHLFTCNQSITQKYANQLFCDVQMQVPLIWQAAKTGFGAGPYYSYHVGIGHDSGITAFSWDQAPECVETIRSKMQYLATHEGGMKRLRIDQMTLVGWHTSGNRKGTKFAATDVTIALLCLGADIELSITPKGGYDENVRWDMDMYPDSSFDDSLSTRVDNGDEEDAMDLLDLEGLELGYPELPDADTPPHNGHPDIPAHNPTATKGDIEDSDDEEDIPLAISTARRKEVAVAKQSAGKVLTSTSVSATASTAVDKRVPETGKSNEKVKPMFITLVHGDVLLLSGDEFEYALHRTGMSVLAIGVDLTTKAAS